MPVRTLKFPMIPWEGGLDLTSDVGFVKPNMLTVCDNVEFGERSSKKRREGINQNYDSGSDGSDTIIGLHDFWYGTTIPRTQRLVSVTTGKKIYSYNAGTRSADLMGGTAWGTTPTVASMITLNNLCLIAVDGGTNILKKYDGSTVADLGGTPPTGSILCEHLGRVWTNSKASPDFVYYSETGNPEIWLGTGDSGGFPIGTGDGDPGGITALFSFKGSLFVTKRTKLYRIDGYNPEEMIVTKISDSIGCIAHNSVCTIDESDVVFVSERGIHSLEATQKYGDFEGTFLSYDIQKKFNEEFTKLRLPYVSAAFLPSKNSVYFALTDSEIGTTANNAVYSYHFTDKAWSRYVKNLGVSSLIKGNDSTKLRLYGGLTTGRVAQFNTSNTYDTNGSGSSVAISYRIKTGKFSVTRDFTTEAAFKKLSLWFTQYGVYNITATVWIDNYSGQTLSFSDSTGSDVLGTTFILGTSLLGASLAPAPYTQTIDGRGRLIQLQIDSTGTLDIIELLGFALTYEPIGSRQETLTSPET